MTSKKFFLRCNSTDPEDQGLNTVTPPKKKKLPTQYSLPTFKNSSISYYFGIVSNQKVGLSYKNLGGKTDFL